MAIALIGIVALTIGLGGEIRIRLKLDGLEAYSREGFYMFIFALSWAYWFRLIFWNRVSLHYQNLVRNLLSLLIAVEPPMAVATLLLLVTQPQSQTEDEITASILITVFAIAGIACQISTVIWLLRYRKE